MVWPSVQVAERFSSVDSIVNKSHVFLYYMSCVFQSNVLKQNNHRRKICPFRMLIAALTVARRRVAYRQCDLNISHIDQTFLIILTVLFVSMNLSTPDCAHPGDGAV